MPSSDKTETTAADPGQDLETETMRNLGAEIRRIRRDQGLTLQEIAARTGLSVSMLSMLERGVAGASIGTLVAVSSALGVQLGRLFDATPEPDSPVTRRANQPRFEASPGVLRRTVHHNPDDGIEIVVLELDSGTDTGRNLIRHAGDEYMLVTSGSLDVELAGDRLTLDQGDGMRIATGELHRFINATDAPVEVVLTTFSLTH